MPISAGTPRRLALPAKCLFHVVRNGRGTAPERFCHKRALLRTTALRHKRPYATRWNSDVRCCPHNGLKSDIAPCPRCAANIGSQAIVKYDSQFSLELFVAATRGRNGQLIT